MYEHGEEQMSDDEFAENAIISASDPSRTSIGIRELEELGATVIVLQNNSGGNRRRSRSTAARCCRPSRRAGLIPRRVAVVRRQGVPVRVAEEGHVADAGVDRLRRELARPWPRALPWRRRVVDA